MQGNYAVVIEEFAERHYIKSFQKKYKTAWEITREAIIAELEHIDTLLCTDRAETIADGGTVKIIKTRFRVANSKESAKTSGNRCIVAFDGTTATVRVLLVYGKTDLGSNNETQEWKRKIRDSYPEYKTLITV